MNIIFTTVFGIEFVLKLFAFRIKVSNIYLVSDQLIIGTDHWCNNIFSD